MAIINNCTLKKVEIGIDHSFNYQGVTSIWDNISNALLFIVASGDAYPNSMLETDMFMERIKVNSLLDNAGQQKLKVFVSPQCYTPRNIIRQKYDIVRNSEKADILVMPNQINISSYDNYYTCKNLLVEYTNTVTNDKTFCYYIVLPNYDGRMHISRTAGKDYKDVTVDNDKFIKKMMSFEGMIPQYTTFTYREVTDTVRYAEQDDVASVFYGNNPDNKVIICEKYLPMDMPTQFNVETMKSLYYCADKDVFEKAFVASNYMDYPLCAKMIYQKQKRRTLWFSYRAKINRKMLSVIDDMKLDEGYYKWSEEKISPEDYNLFIDFLMDIANVKEKGFISKQMYEEFENLDYIHFLPVGFAIKRPAKNITEPTEIKSIWYE